MSGLPRVTVAGGGLAGLTAALRLAERGYRVTLYEQKGTLGGDLASRTTPAGHELDVYPHMYLSWYHNFWKLLDEVTPGDPRERFVEFSSVKQLRRGRYPKFDALTDAFSPSLRRMFQNLRSGVGPPADMFVFGYSAVDLLAERTCPTMGLDNVGVTGYLRARPYMTERAVRATDSFITTVWAIPSSRTSAEDYRTYLAYSVANHTPEYRLANGPARRQVIEPITAALERMGVEIVRSTQVTRVSWRHGRVTEIGLEDVAFNPSSYTWVGAGNHRSEPIDELVLAVPPDALSWLVRSGEIGHRLVDAEPRLAEVSRLTTERIPILHVYFRRKLRDIPPEPVGLYESELALAFTDISQTWAGSTDFAGRTVLAVSASNPYALPATDPRSERPWSPEQPQDDALAILRELARYLEFEPGAAWGESPDIDWDHTRYEPNADAQLFINEADTDVWRPRAEYDSITNLALAGDFCANRIGMTTIESAVTTGLEAARVVVDRHGIGNPIEIAEPNAGSGAWYLFLRCAWGPYAIAAKALSTSSDYVGSLRRLLTPSRAPADQRRES